MKFSEREFLFIAQALFSKWHEFSPSAKKALTIREYIHLSSAITTLLNKSEPQTDKHECLLSKSSIKPNEDGD
jgi:hypothetical protein